MLKVFYEWKIYDSNSRIKLDIENFQLIDNKSGFRGKPNVNSSVFGSTRPANPVCKVSKEDAANEEANHVSASDHGKLEEVALQVPVRHQSTLGQNNKHHHGPGKSG